MFGSNNNDHVQYPNYFGGNMDMTSFSHNQRRNQRCNYTSDDYSPPNQSMYQNESYPNNMPYYNNGRQSSFEQNESSFTYNYIPNEQPSYYNQNYPQYNSTNRRSRNLDRSYIMPTLDDNYNNSSYKMKNASSRKEYIRPVSESEYENEKRREVRIERSNMTSQCQKSFFSQFFDSIFE